MSAELTAPREMTLEGALAAVRGALPVRDGRRRRHERGLYDTFDRRLSAAGLTLWHEAGHLVLGACRQPMRRPGKPVLLPEIPPGSLRDAVGPVIEMRALLPLARVRSHEHALEVLDGEEKIVVRLALTDSEVPGRSLGVRARLDGLRGYDQELERVREVLVDELGFAPAERALADEVSPAPAIVRPALERGQPAGAATAAVLTHLLGVIEANLDGTLEDIDTEFLHDLRVAVRRSRSVQKELRGVFDPAELEFFRAEFRWLQEVTGPTRDLDVWLLEFDEYRALIDGRFRGHLEPLLEVLRVRRRHEYRLMCRALRSERAGALRVRWREYLLELPGLPAGAGADATRPIEDLAGPRIARVYKRMVKAGQAIDEDSPAEALHELRKQGKELRYLLELFGLPIYGEQLARPLIRTLKGLQDVLGRHQDRAVQAAMVASLRDEVAAGSGPAPALVAMGALAQALIDDERAARNEFARRFADFASSRTQSLVKGGLR
jgi:CHAD domain-containing protein